MYFYYFIINPFVGRLFPQCPQLELGRMACWIGRCLGWLWLWPDTWLGGYIVTPLRCTAISRSRSRTRP